jgi:phosphoglycolate phosphatase
MKYKAVIFDLDGTLLDTLDDLADSMNDVLEARGFPVHDAEAYKTFVGSGAEKLVSRALPAEQRDDNIIAECLKEFRKNYSDNWNNKTTPYDGIPELLNELTDKGIKMAVLSNKPHQYTELCVKELLPDWDFKKVLGQREGVPIKPDPFAPLEISAFFDLPPQDFIFLGDSDVDMRTAVNAGMYAIGALWGFRPELELRKAGADRLIVHPIEMLDLHLL